MDGNLPGPQKAETGPDVSPQTGKKLERAVMRRTREARAKRIILIGSLASFLGFFGLSIAASQFTNAQATDTQPPATVTFGHRDDNENQGPAFFNNGNDRPQIRTRTS